MYPSTTAKHLDAWLLDVANARGATIVKREDFKIEGFTSPPENLLSNEELITAICMLQRRDYPQSLRAAAQIISSGRINVAKLIHYIRQERAGLVLGELAKQALIVEPEHVTWKAIDNAFHHKFKFNSPIIHWQRLAWPVMKDNRLNIDKWELVK